MGDLSCGAAVGTPKSEFFRLNEGLDPMVDARDLGWGSRSLPARRSPDEVESLIEVTLPLKSSLLVRRFNK